MSLEKPPPSRYRIEEKDGRLIVHDSMASIQASSTVANVQPQSTFDDASKSLTAAPQPPSPTRDDAGKAKRGATVVAIGILLAFFLIITSLWPIMVMAMVIAPIRKPLLGRVLPAVKRYIDDGRMS